MNSFGGYDKVSVGTIPAAKLRKALDGSTVRLTNAELTGDRVMIVSKLNAKAIKKVLARHYYHIYKSSWN